MGISCWIAHKSVWSPDNTAIQFRGEDISYKQLEIRVAALTRYLNKRLGVAQGDRVAYLGWNSPSIVELLFACARLGAIFVPLNARLTAPQLTVMIKNAGPKLLFAGSGCTRTAAACRKLPTDFRIISLESGGTDEPDEAIDFARLPESYEPIQCNPNRNQDIPVLIAYTSGTTGTPKGCVFTQDALTFTAINSNNAYNMRGTDRILTFLPMFHVGGLLIHSLPAFHIGAMVIILERFEPGTVLDQINRQRVSLLLAPPVFSRELTSHQYWGKTDLSSLRCVGIGSTFVPPEVMQAWFDRNVPTQQNYGLTEGVPILAAPWEHHRRKARSAGTSMLYMQARVFDDKMNRQPPGQPGEIMLRGRSLFSGYWRNPEATTEAFKNGWFRTGDMGYTDEEHYFYILGRKKNIVIVGSSNVYPADLERILGEHPEISEAAVIGVPDPDTGEALVACIIPKSGSQLDKPAILALFEGRLASYQIPKHVLFMKDFPRTSLGKVQKFELKRLATRLFTENTDLSHEGR